MTAGAHFQFLYKLKQHYLYPMTLPIEAIKDQFLSTLRQQNVIVHAPTGSGKSTNLPLWASTQGRVLVVQPRRIAATSLANYLAEQCQQKPGQRIGYAIRFEAKMAAQTQVVFATPGVALRWFFEQQLADFDVVMLDEFHERRWDTDLLLALLKHHGKHRLILTSATLDDRALSAYLTTKALTSHGRTYPISSYTFASDARAMPSSQDLAARVRQACVYALDNSGADILVFLPGRAEIAACVSACQDLPAECISLHGSSPLQEQQRALRQGPQRRIIFATNVAETSLTVPGVECVIDSGLERRTHLRKGKTVLGLDAIAQDSMRQRMGRCGRIAPGLYIRLFGEHAPLLSTTPVEVEREALDELVLASACAGIAVDDLPLLTAPPGSSLQRAMTKLQRLGAVTADGLATALGKTIYPLPVDADLGMLIHNMPSNVLRQAMIDLAAAIATPAALFSPSSSSEREQLQAQLGEQYALCDLALHIAVVRGGAAQHILTINSEALSEARTYANYLRHAYQLPELDKAARYQHATLVEAIAELNPHCVYVKRDNRRGSFANGEDEVRPAKSSLLQHNSNAALVLATFSLAGRGKKHADTLATMCAPMQLSQVRQAVPYDTTLGQCYWYVDEQCPEGEIRADIIHSYAGVELGSSHQRVDGQHLSASVVALMRDNQLFAGSYEQITQAIAQHNLYQAYHQQPAIDMDADTFIAERLHSLGVQSQEDLQLIEAEDLHYQGIDPWHAKDFNERFPLQVTLPSMVLNIEYHFRAKRLIAHYHSGERKDPPKRWELPAWSGLKIQYKKASKLVDIR